MLTTAQLDPKDYKYVVERPDSGFSPERNKATINETIQSTEKYFKQLGAAMDEGLGERIEAVAAYGCYRFNKGNMTAKDYFGKQVLSRLVGEHILEKVKVMKSVNKLNGNDKFNDFILL